MTAFSSKWKYKTLVAVSRIPQTKNLVISFLVLHRTAKKFTTIYNARAEQLFFS